MKNLFLSLLVMFTVVGTVSAQDAPVNRSLSFYLDSFTGQLNTGEDPLFTGNEFEFGMTYSQNFATVPWLSMWVKALVVTGTSPVTDADESFVGNTGYGIQGYGNPRAQVGINLGGYAIFAMDTRGLLAQENYYTLKFGAAGNLTFQTILEMWMVPNNTGTQVNGQYSKDFQTVVDLFEIRFNYGITVAPGWTYNSKLGFRLGSGGYDWKDHAANPVDSSAARFGQSFHIRWENQVIWAVTPKFYTWAQLRYQIKHLAYAPQETAHDIFFQAGLGYSFDFSTN